MHTQTTRLAIVRSSSSSTSPAQPLSVYVIDCANRWRFSCLHINVHRGSAPVSVARTANSSRSCVRAQCNGHFYALGKHWWCASVRWRLQAHANTCWRSDWLLRNRISEIFADFSISSLHWCWKIIYFWEGFLGSLLLPVVQRLLGTDGLSVAPLPRHMTQFLFISHETLERCNNGSHTRDDGGGNSELELQRSISHTQTHQKAMHQPGYQRRARLSTAQAPGA